MVVVVVINVVITFEETKIEFNQCLKSDKAPFIIYADLESLIEKINRYKKNPQKLSTTKVRLFIF